MGLIIEAISDTHGMHRSLDLKGGDILVHSGDATGHGTEAQSRMFLEWLASLKDKYKHVIFTPGNHDIWFEDEPDVAKELCDSLGIVYLVDSGAEIEGLKFWGTPVTPYINSNMAFGRSLDDTGFTYNKYSGAMGYIKPIRSHWELIPMDTDVLVTHAPAKNLLDDHGKWGCPILESLICKINPKVHIFGHIHESSGFMSFNDILFANAACLNGWYSYHKDSAIIKFDDGLTIEDFYDSIK
jgi:Icc-related predicted phosphoesterase